MALTRHFKETVLERAQQDPAFRKGLLTRGIAYILAGKDEEDIQVGKSLLRDYINATIGFPLLARKTSIPKPSLMYMLGTKGNPSIIKLHEILAPLLENEGLKNVEDFPKFLGKAVA
jgi:hypothetical protein